MKERARRIEEHFKKSLRVSYKFLNVFFWKSIFFLSGIVSPSQILWPILCFFLVSFIFRRSKCTRNSRLVVMATVRCQTESHPPPPFALSYLITVFPFLQNLIARPFRRQQNARTNTVINEQQCGAIRPCYDDERTRSNPLVYRIRRQNVELRSCTIPIKCLASYCNALIMIGICLALTVIAAVAV